MKSPLETFFKLGEKVTGGDPVRQVSWNYYMMWVIFLAFFSIFLGNIIEFFGTQRLANLGWAAFGIAVMWFQYGSLKQFYEMKKAVKLQANQPQKEFKIESAEEMLEGFKNENK